MKKPQLFLLHFAGGNCYSFQFMTALLKDFDVIALELPGRGKRMGQELLTDFDAAADDMFAQVKQKLSGATLLLYGHSMGAYLALRIANRLEREGIVPACVVVSGNPGPATTERPKKERYLMEHEAFKAELIKIGGVPEELLANEELFGFFEPILRADFRIAENHGMENEPATSAPLFAMMGSDEEQVEAIGNWERYTTAGFRYEILKGDHFFIHKHPRRIAAILRERYQQARLVQQ